MLTDPSAATLVAAFFVASTNPSAPASVNEFLLTKIGKDKQSTRSDGFIWVQTSNLCHLEIPLRHPYNYG